MSASNSFVNSTETSERWRLLHVGVLLGKSFLEHHYIQGIYFYSQLGLI